MIRRRKPPSATVPLVSFMELGDVIIVAVAACLLLAASAYFAQAAELAARLP